MATCCHGCWGSSCWRCIVIVQIIRHQVEVLYTTTLIVRTLIVAVLIGLFIYSHDPLFISLVVVVVFGMVLTGSTFLLDRRSTAPVMAPR